MELNQEQVLEIIPQRDPLLLVNAVKDLVPGESCTGILNVTADMPVFAGHFPGNPVLPGVYQIESAAQTCSILYLMDERYKGKTPYFLGANNISFKKMVKPGDVISIYATHTRLREDKAISFSHAVLKVGEDVVSEVDVVLAYR